MQDNARLSSLSITFRSNHLSKPCWTSATLFSVKHVLPRPFEQAMLDQRDFTGRAALHHAVADMEERHQVVQSLLAAKAQVTL